MNRVAVIGAGVMGSAIARRLLATGHEVFVFDPAIDKRTALTWDGARAALSAREAAAPVTFVICSLNTADIVEQAVFGPGGIAEIATERMLLIDMSSIDPGRTAQLAERLRHDTGMGWVDAPLSGGASAASSGALTLMIGGSDVDVARALPVLSHLSSHHTHLGAVGCGQTVKLINQLLCANTFLAVAEAVRFAEGMGVEVARIPDALASGRADSRILQEFMAKMGRRDYSPTGRIDNMLKDLDTIQAAARAGGIILPVTTLITDLHRALVASGLGPADSAEYMKLFDLPTVRGP